MDCGGQASIGPHFMHSQRHFGLGFPTTEAFVGSVSIRKSLSQRQIQAP